MKRTPYNQEHIIEIGKRVKESRTYKKYSQKELADLLHLKKDVIRRIEVGELKSIDEELIIRIANCLQCNSDYLLLKTDLYSTSNPNIHYLQYPNMQKTVDGFIYTHQQLRTDLDYIARYMHKEYQETIISTIHNMTLFHKIAVSYPNTDESLASMLSPDDISEIISTNFFNRYKR